jgi:hypothetical protein
VPISVAPSRATKEGNLRREDASALARSRSWAEPAAADTRTAGPRSRAHRGAWRAAPAAENSRLALAPVVRVLAPGLRRSKRANGIRKTRSRTVNLRWTDTESQGGNTYARQNAGYQPSDRVTAEDQNPSSRGRRDWLTGAPGKFSIPIFGLGGLGNPFANGFWARLMGLLRGPPPIAFAPGTGGAALSSTAYSTPRGT